MPYTANSARDRSADYLQQSMANLTQTIERNRQEREKKEQEKKAKEAVMAAGTALYGDGFDLKDAPQETWGQVIQLAQAKKDEPMRQLAAENAALRQKIDQAELARINAAAEQVARNRTAVGNAMGAPWADGSAAAQVQRAAAAGADAQTLQQLSVMAENLAQAQQRGQPKPRPVETTFGGVPAVVANGNVQFIPQPKAAAADRLTAQIQALATQRAKAIAEGNTDLARTYDDAIKKVSRPSLTLKEELLELAADGKLGGRVSTPTPEEIAAAAKAGAKKATDSTPATGKKGERRRQNGKIYQFDGTNWVEEK